MGQNQQNGRSRKPPAAVWAIGGVLALCAALKAKEGMFSPAPMQSALASEDEAALESSQTSNRAPTFNWKPLLAIGGAGVGLWAWQNPDKLTRIVASALQGPPLAAPAPRMALPPAAPPMSASTVSLERLTAEVLATIGTPSKAAPPSPAYTPEPDAVWRRLAPHPSVIIVLGKRGSGKSALGYRLLELLRDVAAPYVVGLPREAQTLLPEWIGCIDALEDVPQGSVVLLDESYLQYSARASMTAAGRGLGAIVNLSRQRGQTLIFIVHETRQLDVNAVSQADVIAIKELTEISADFERGPIKRLTAKARGDFAALSANRRADKRAWTWVYSEAADYSGMVRNALPSFWRPALSKAFAAGVSPDGANRPVERSPMRRGSKTPRSEKIARAREMRAAGLSLSQIAKAIGVKSKSTVLRYLSEGEGGPPQA